MFNNKTYDIMKWVALIVLPALAVLYTTLAQIWGLPYGAEVSETIMAIDLFMGALLGISNVRYNALQDDSSNETEEVDNE